MHSFKLPKVLTAIVLICLAALPAAAIPGSIDTDISAIDDVSSGTADLPIPTSSSDAGLDDSDQDNDGDSMDDPMATNSTPTTEDGSSSTSQQSSSSTMNPIIAHNFQAAAGVPLWANLEVEDSKSSNPTSDSSQPSVLARAEYNAHPRNLTAREPKDYELHCGGTHMGTFMRTCGNAPPITGYLCQATCYCTKAGCIKCRNQGLGSCSLSVMEATCRIPNMSFACACRVKGTGATDELAMMCNNPQ